jgi:hypothetical protein
LKTQNKDTEKNCKFFKNFEKFHFGKFDKYKKKLQNLNTFIRSELRFKLCKIVKSKISFGFSNIKIGIKMKRF